MNTPIRIGTRGSDLALWQANHIQSLLKEIGVPSEIHIIKTQGDKIQHLSFDKMEGKGFFTKEIEEALLNNDVDLAIHSHKDLETAQPAGLMIGAVPPRASVEDLLLIHPDSADANGSFTLKSNAVIGTSSARRKSQLKKLIPDCETKDLRGNVPTRIQKLRDGNYDAIVLAKAGVERLGLDLSDLTVVTFDPTSFVPAPAQGALAVQIRENDAELAEKLQALQDDPTKTQVEIERVVLSKLEGGCQLPFGAYCKRVEGQFHLHIAYSADANGIADYFRFQGNDRDTLINEALEKLSL